MYILKTQITKLEMITEEPKRRFEQVVFEKQNHHYKYVSSPEIKLIYFLQSPIKILIGSFYKPYDSEVYIEKITRDHMQK